MYRFLLRPRWLGFLAGVLLFAVACVGLARWQLDRLHQRQGVNAAVAQAETDAPQPVADAFAAGAVPQEWRRVSATGRYDVDHEVLLRGQLQDGRPGFHVLTPLVTTAGSALLVDRGWIPISSSGGATAEPDVPVAAPGAVSVVARVRLSEQVRTDRPARSGARLQVAAVNLADLSAAMPYPLYPAYVELTEQQPRAVDSPQLIAAPVADEGPHLAYAVQWFLFGGLGLFGYGWYARQEAQRRRLGATHPAEPSPVEPALTRS